MVGGHLSQIFKSLVLGWRLSFGSKKIRSLAAKPNQKDMEFIAELANNGVIKPVIERYFPFDQTGEAVNYINQGDARGKVVINGHRDSISIP
jgi:NADPH:quinone reductase-like Zn-dependent oxidoreductase